MRPLKIVAIAVAVAGSAMAVTPSSAKTAFQYWAQGEGVYVSSKDHPPELYQFFGDLAGVPNVPPPYYSPYGPPPAYPYGEPGY